MSVSRLVKFEQPCRSGERFVGPVDGMGAAVKDHAGNEIGTVISVDVVRGGTALEITAVLDIELPDAPPWVSNNPNNQGR